MLATLSLVPHMPYHPLAVFEPSRPYAVIPGPDYPFPRRHWLPISKSSPLAHLRSVSLNTASSLVIGCNRNNRQGLQETGRTGEGRTPIGCTLAHIIQPFSLVRKAAHIDHPPCHPMSAALSERGEEEVSERREGKMLVLPSPGHWDESTPLLAMHDFLVGWLVGEDPAILITWLLPPCKQPSLSLRPFSLFLIVVFNKTIIP